MIQNDRMVDLDIPAGDIEEFADKVYDFAVNKMNWSREWSPGGCYLHLEVSEFIEALRGKGDPLEELGDVLITLFSVARHYNLNPKDAIKSASRKIDNIVEGKRICKTC